jgi:hypothetical protein
MSMDSEQLALNTPVVTLDGDQFGYVKELHGGYFKIDVPMGKDFWLSTAYIGDQNMDRVTLTLRKDELDEHRLEAPGLEHQESAGSAAVIDDQTMLSQRERMERELAQQNERLRSGIV